MNLENLNKKYYSVGSSYHSSMNDSPVISAILRIILPQQIPGKESPSCA